MKVIGFASLTEHANQLLLDALWRADDRLDAATQQILDQMRESDRRGSAIYALRAEVGRLQSEKECVAAAIGRESGLTDPA